MKKLLLFFLGSLCITQVGCEATCDDVYNVGRKKVFLYIKMYSDSEGKSEVTPENNEPLWTIFCHSLELERLKQSMTGVIKSGEKVTFGDRHKVPPRSLAVSKFIALEVTDSEGGDTTSIDLSEADSTATVNELINKFTNIKDIKKNKKKVTFKVQVKEEREIVYRVRRKCLFGGYKDVYQGDFFCDKNASKEDIVSEVLDRHSAADPCPLDIVFGVEDIGTRYMSAEKDSDGREMIDFVLKGYCDTKEWVRDAIVSIIVLTYAVVIGTDIISKLKEWKKRGSVEEIRRSLSTHD